MRKNPALLFHYRYHFPTGIAYRIDNNRFLPLSGFDIMYSILPLRGFFRIFPKSSLQNFTHTRVINQLSFLITEIKIAGIILPVQLLHHPFHGIIIHIDKQYPVIAYAFTVQLHRTA